MATLKEIKGRIKSVGDTAKITNAMYLISSTKFRSSKQQLADTAAYFDSLYTEIRAISGGVEADECVYMRRTGSNVSVLVLASDKGFCGDFNKAVIRTASQVIAENPGCRVYIVGEKVKKYFALRNMPYETDLSFNLRNPDSTSASELSRFFCNEFEQGRTDKVIAVYTSTNGGSKKKVTAKQILPIEPEGEEDVVTDTEFFPSKAAVLESLVPIYLDGIFHSILLQSYVSEQSSRMFAMDAANRNAQNLLAELTLQYNHLRQNAITTEITEISGERMHK